MNNSFVSAFVLLTVFTFCVHFYFSSYCVEHTAFIEFIIYRYLFISVVIFVTFNFYRKLQNFDELNKHIFDWYKSNFSRVHKST